MEQQPFKPHSSKYRFRRFLNWFPLGLSYAFLYMGRYNLTVSKNAMGSLMSKEAFGIIFAAGAFTYGFAFLINGPIADKIGGRKTMLISLLGSLTMNAIMGFYVRHILLAPTAPSLDTLTWVMALMYAANMYFQSFGAVSIVKVNSHWFHVRERGGFSGIFGTMISLGIFFAFTVNGWLLDLSKGYGPEHGKAPWWVFFAPSILLAIMFLIELFLLKDSPGKAGFEDFDTGDEKLAEEGVELSSFELIKKILSHPIIITVAFIEFCTGVLRNGVMHWFPIYAKEVWVLPSHHFVRHGSWGHWYTIVPFFLFSVGFFFGAFILRRMDKKYGWATVAGAVLFLLPFLQGGWGGILMVAGVAGGNIAGWISDLVFGSRRAPVAAILYGGLVVSSIFMWLTMGGDTNIVGYSKVFDLRPGDKIIAVGNKTGLKTQEDVQKAWSCLPAHCVDKKAHWDAKSCTCVEGKTAQKAPKVSRYISVKVIRDKEEIALRIKDRWNRLKNGEHREMPIIFEGKTNVIKAIKKRLDQLYPSDQIIAVGEKKGLKTWRDVSKAVACLPARCKTPGSKWDTKRCICSRNPREVAKGKLTYLTYIPLTVIRDGKTIQLKIPDTPNIKKGLVAGHKRKLAVGPKISINTLWLALVVFFMSLSVIGTHGLLSGTATMDFGGRKGAATAVGMIDGFVYLGTGIQSVALGYLTTLNWAYWPLFLFPFGVIGFVLLLKIWDAIPGGKKNAAH